MNPERLGFLFRCLAWTLCCFQFSADAFSAASDFQGVWVRFFFQGEAVPGAFSDRLSEPLRSRWLACQARASRFQSAIPAPSRSGEPAERYLREKRKLVERAIVALIDRPGIEAQAADYARKAVLFYEWEGMSEGPLAEAAHTETFLREKPDSPLKPFLQVFLAHRWKCAREAMLVEKKREEAIRLQETYRKNMALLLTNPDPLVRAVAGDLDAEPAVYLDPKTVRAAEALLFPAAAGENGSPGTTAPAISLPKALEIAEKTLAEKRIDLRGQILHTATLEFDDGKRIYPDGKPRQGHFWYIHWRWEKPRLGGDFSMRIFMNGEAVVEPHGP